MAATTRNAARRSQLRTWIAGGAVLAITATIAVIASGYDARDTPRADPNVWVTRDAGQYARVNTDTGEIDLVRKVAEPSGIAQVGGSGVLFSHGNGRAWPINAADPLDVSDTATGADSASDSEPDTEPDAERGATTTAANTGTAAASAASTAVDMPDGIRDVIVSGAYVAIRSESGEVYAGRLASTAPGAADDTIERSDRPEDIAGRLESLVQVDIAAAAGAGSADTPDSSARADGDDGTARAADADRDATSPDESDGASATAIDAIGLSETGTLALVSFGDDSLLRYDAALGAFSGDAVNLPGGLQRTQDLQVAFVGDDWVLFDAESSTLWREDGTPTELETAEGALLQASSSGDDAPGVPGNTVLIADGDGLLTVTEDGDAERSADATGAPARPIEVDGTRYAAWVGPGEGMLWRAGQDSVPLDIDEAAGDPGEFAPVFRTNGDRAVLNESRTGLLWTVPDGTAIPLAQWSISDPPKENTGTVIVDDVSEEVPPTAVDDAFGVRPGDPVALPVMLNDYDANKRDVITIVGDSLSESPLPAEFGSVQMLADGQSLTVQVADGATGSATFTYRVTDGIQQSEAATVTLTVAADATNTAPEWCAVDGCQRTWGVPAIVPGGTLVVPILDGWVDPEGDVMMLADAEPVRSEDPVRAIVTADGRLAVRHTDANAGAAEIALTVTVQDSRGERTDRELQVAVRGDAAAEFQAAATSVQVGESRSTEPLDRVAGGSGSYALTDAVVQSGTEAVQIASQPTTGEVVFTGLAVGEATASLTIRDTVTGAEITGLTRVTVTPSGDALTLPPLRAFVRPLSDSNVEVLAAIPGASTRALAVVDAQVRDGELRADVLGHSSVRVAGATGDGAPGRIGTVDVTVSEGAATTTGRLTVFQVPETSTAGPIALADTATVRAGSVVDIPVLDNDVAAPGERLLLHPEITGSGTGGELAFASGSVLRYLAPETPGTYRIGYTTYGASSPESSDVGAVIVTVLPKGSNRDPLPQALTVRVAAGEQSDIVVPLSNIDPDGDRARIAGVDASENPQLAVSLAATGAAISVSASDAAEPGSSQVSYRVRDGFGGTGTGTLTVIVTPPNSTSGAPVAITDYVRLVPGTKTPAAVRPLDNDIDPARGTLSITRVEPNVAGGPDSAEYRRLEQALDTSALKSGVVRVTPSADLGTVSYSYTITSSATSSTVDGLIVVQTSDRVGVQAPQITDTVLNVRDRARLTDAGVDVVTDKVRWSTGDVSSLTLSLWGGTGGNYEAAGTRISGAYDPDGDLVVFKLTGTDITGTEVSSYGFLTIPSLDELRVTLRAGLSALSVDEERTATARITDLVDLGADDRVELRQGAFSVGRADATCTAQSADTIVYDAGAGAPWNDICLIDVRLVGQDTWTSLPVPVSIVPKAPAVELQALTRTVAPGATERIDLGDMVAWQGDRAGDTDDLKFTVSGANDAFSVETSGATATVAARADATPGAQQVLTVAVTGAGSSQAPLSLRVGEAAKDTPRGATVALQCTVGAECGATVVGAPGEYDPFAGKSGSGLTLTSVDPGSCAVGTFSRASDTSVAVTWPAGAVTGATCTVGFTVTDAQGRVGAGSIEFDAQGLPAAPASITQTAYDATSATFSVVLGGQQAHPEVTGVTLTGGGSTSCVAAGPATFQCVAAGLANGEKRDFVARAVNAVGESAPSNSVTAWAYRAPQMPDVSATPVKNPQNTDATGAITVAVSGSSDTGAYQVSLGGVDLGTIAGPTGQREFAGLSAGPLQVRVTPITNLDLPNVGAGISTGEAREIQATVIGAPKLAEAVLTSTGDTTARVAAVGVGDWAKETLNLSYAVTRANQSPDCFAGGQASPNFTNLSWARNYHGSACVTSDYGRTIVLTGTERIGADVPPPTINSGYMVDPTVTVDAALSSATYLNYTAPSVTVIPGAIAQFNVNGVIDGTFTLSPDTIPVVEVRQCLEAGAVESCSIEWEQVSPDGAPTTVTVALNGVCYDAASPPAALQELLTISAAAQSWSAVVAGTADPATNQIPLNITWTGPFSGLAPVTLMACTVPADPAPEPPPTP